MSNETLTSQQNSPAPHHCGKTAEEHVAQIWVGLQVVGAGGGCQGTYNALIEIADTLKRNNNFPDYTPTGQLDKLMDEAEQLAGQNIVAEGRAN